MDVFRQRFPWIGPDLQTLRNYVVRPSDRLPGRDGRTMELPMPDGTGDRLIAVLNKPEVPHPGAATVLLIHGLTGVPR